MKIKFVKINNILSIGDVELEFKDSGLTLLDGWNHDDGTANGAGKSSIPNAIAFGLFDNMPRKISKSEFIRQGTKRGFVHVGVEVDGDLLEVKRSRPKNVEYFVNGNPQDMTQEEFEKKLRLSYDQFLICAYAAQTEGQRFISLNDTDRKSFILRLMDLERFSDKKKIIDSKIKSLNVDKIEIDKVLTACESKVAVYREQIVDVQAIEAEINSINISHLNSELAKYSSIKRPDYSEFESVRTKIDKKVQALDAEMNECTVARRMYANISKDLQKLEDFKPDDSLTCPHCNGSFFHVDGENKTLDDIERSRNLSIASKKEELQQLVKQINESSGIESKKEELRQVRTKIEEKIRRQEQDYRNASSISNDLRSKIVIQQNRLESLKSSLSKQEQIASKIEEISTVAKKAEDKLLKLNEELEVLSTLATILSPTGAPAYVVDSIVDMFNQKVSDFVSLIWPNATYELQAFKENKSGDIKAKFSDKLVISGRNVSLGSLSGGEFRCLSLAIDFAVIDVVESLFGFQISPIFLDEPFEGLDSTNREKVIDLLDKLSTSRQIWIIDHASEAKAMFTDVVRIEKRNAVSYLA